MSMIQHYHTRFHIAYRTSGKHHFYNLIFVILGIILLVFLALQVIFPTKEVNFFGVSYGNVLLAGFASLSRLAVAYAMSLVVAIPLVLFTLKVPRLEKYLLPIYDILQSVPVLAFFPIIVLLFIKFNFFEGAAIFVLVIAMLWNMVFSMIAGFKTIPADIQSAAAVFQAKGFKKIWMVTLPSIFPFIVTGSLLAWAQGWTILIVAEVLHNFIPNSLASTDLFGLGSLLANSISQNNNSEFIASLIVMIVAISLLNFFVWQKLLHLSERYKFD
jgi:NitT/TauT family transport system permease protein